MILTSYGKSGSSPSSKKEDRKKYRLAQALTACCLEGLFSLNREATWSSISSSRALSFKATAWDRSFFRNPMWKLPVCLALVSHSPE